MKKDIDIIQKRKNLSHDKSWAVNRQINDIVENHLSRFFNPWWVEELDEQILSPRLEVMDSPEEVSVYAELPGMEPQDIDVSFSNGILTITGEKKNKISQNKKGCVFSERTYGFIQRQIPLPDTVDVNSVEAQYENGVLMIEMPKKKEAKENVKKIQVKRK